MIYMGTPVDEAIHVYHVEGLLTFDNYRIPCSISEQMIPYLACKNSSRLIP